MKSAAKVSDRKFESNVMDSELETSDYDMLSIDELAQTNFGSSRL